MQPALPHSEFIERDFQLPPEKALLAFPPGDLQPGTEKVAEVFQYWKSAAWQRTEDSKSLNDLRDALRYALGMTIEEAMNRRGKGEPVT